MDTELPFSAPAERNKAPILAELRRLLPPAARVLEVASGTGQHAEHFARAMPAWQWQPTDVQASALPAIARRCAALGNVAAPRVLDVLAWPEGLGAIDAVYCANMLHIAPWACCAGLVRGAARVLRGGGLLVLYGPFIEDDVPTVPSNEAFDASLRARDAGWGLRRLAEVQREAAAAGLAFVERVAMPANNLLVVFARA